MKYRVGIAVAMVVGFLTIIAASCGGDGTPSPSPTPTASSEPLPTLVPAVPLPTPTSVPTELRRMALQLAISHGRISASWEQLHLDFDTWRQGLISCDVSSVQGQLAQFAADTVIIATSAQDLPRLASVRELADQVLEVIQAETRVMAGLRDRWHGGNSGAFQEFDSIHSVVIQTLQEVDDAIQDLKERSSVDARAEAGAFVREFGQLSSFWDSFYASYDAFRGETLTSSQAVSILNDLVDDLQNVLLTARDLPDEPALRPGSSCWSPLQKRRRWLYGRSWTAPRILASPSL